MMRAFAGIALAMAACGGHPPPAAVTPAPPPPLTCEQVAPAVDVLVRQRIDHQGAQRARVEPFVRAMKVQIVQSCSADGWSMALRECVVSARTHADFERCERLFTPAQRRKFELASDQIAQTTLATEAPVVAPPSGDSPTGIPECDRYLQTFERMLACDKLPEATRATLRESVAQQRQAWASLAGPSIPAESRRAAADACAQAREAVAQSLTALGCPP